MVYPKHVTASLVLAAALAGSSLALASGHAPVDGLAPLYSTSTAMARMVRTGTGSAVQSAFNQGDVFVGIASGLYQHYDNAGNFLEVLDTGDGGYTTGGAFNSAGNLYATAFSAARVAVFDLPDPHNVIQQIDISAHGGEDPEDVVFDASGNFYVTAVFGNGNIQKFDASGAWVQNFSTGRSDWFDLASDQTTMFYTVESGAIHRIDLGTNTPLTDFANIGGITYALRLLAPGDGSGGLIAAHSNDIVRLNGAGAVVQSYDAPGEDSWFSLNLDPNGTSFWAADFFTSHLYRFNVATGAIELGPISTGTSPNTVFGIIVKGEITAGVCFENDATPEFTAPTPTCGSTIDAAVGSPVSFVVAGQDSDTVKGNAVSVTLDVVAGDLPSGATMTPSLPAVGNPVASTFSWTPTAGDAGDHLIRFTLNDRCSDPVQCSVTVHVTTNRPPDCSNAVASETVLWPPNHSYHAISVNGVTDPDGDPVTITITGVTQDEPVNTRGDGNTCPDATTAGGQAAVRAERTGVPGIPGNGRVYGIHFTADDGKGGSCSGVVYACVPHDLDHPTCVDDGQRYNSLGPCTGADKVALEAVSLSVGRVDGSLAALSFALPHDVAVDLSAFDISGRRVATIEHGMLTAGTYERAWNMSAVDRGVYFLRLQAGGVTVTRTVMKLHP